MTDQKMAVKILIVVLGIMHKHRLIPNKCDKTCRQK